MNDSEVVKRKNERIHKLVVRFIDNLHNAVWARKEKEMVKEEHEQQSFIMDMYAKNLLSQRTKVDPPEVPVGLAKINKRDPNNPVSKGSIN